MIKKLLEQAEQLNEGLPKGFSKDFKYAMLDEFPPDVQKALGGVRHIGTYKSPSGTYLIHLQSGAWGKEFLNKLANIKSFSSVDFDKTTKGVILSFFGDK